MKYLYALIALIIIALVGWFLLGRHVVAPTTQNADYKTVTVTIDAKPVKIGENGTQYFGNELKKDLNGDGREDVAFIITSQPGGSGTFYYLAGAIATSSGYVGTDAVFIGDRIAPQTTESGPGREVIVNYADRKPSDPFTTPPSVGKSLYLLLDPSTLTWGQVDQNYTGDSNFVGVEGVATLGPTCPVQRIPPDPSCADKPFTSQLKVVNGSGATVKTFTPDSTGAFRVVLPAGTYSITQAGTSMLPRCSSPSFTVLANKPATGVAVSCDTGIR